MAADLTASDLRRLADALDDMTKMSADTGVTITAYSGTQITMNDQVIRIRWIGPDGDKPGHYLAEWPDE
jgi:hypothetical protein